MNKAIAIFGKAVSYFVILIIALVALFRGAVMSIWTSHSDFGLLAAPLVGVLGFVGILWIAGKLLNDLINTIKS